MPRNYSIEKLECNCKITSNFDKTNEAENPVHLLTFFATKLFHFENPNCFTQILCSKCKNNYLTLINIVRILDLDSNCTLQ